MVWVRIDDREPEAWIADGLSVVACWARVELLAYANRNLTDGFVRAPAARRAVSADDPSAVLDELVEAGALDVVDGGFVLTGYHPNQPKREDVERAREVDKERQKANRQRSKEARAQRVAAHARGDHSLCFTDQPCRSGEAVRPDVHSDVSSDSDPTSARSPTCPDARSPMPVPDPKGGNGRSGDGRSPEGASVRAGALPDVPPAPPSGRDLTEDELDALAADLGVGPPLSVLRVLRERQG
ncbi:hypothetical protein [Kineococcus arenarius]|uniref:hypothetical protein n=1 Tax=unclassified Kineococcus TaxID=2621656 RepID=UPI003D7D32D4